MKNNNKQPRFLVLWQIRLPITGLVSILHRISGVALFLALPFLLYLLQTSLQSEEGFYRVGTILASWPLKLCALLLLWLFVHHLLAGIRVLLIDMEWGVELPAARRSASVVVALAVLLALLGAVV